jgi:propionyl-CoA synthetase
VGKIYDEVYKKSIEQPEEFWAEAAEDVFWYKKWDTVLSEENDYYRWFKGGSINTCYNALDYHIENGLGDQLALIYDSPVTDTKQQFTYTQLRDKVAKVAGILVEQGVSRGDRVVIYMPMIPEAAVAMLACARIGAIHSVVFGGFAAHELATRINDAQPKVVISASCGVEIAKVIEYKPLLDEAIRQADHKPDSCLILQREMCKASMDSSRDIDWEEAEKNAQPADCVPLDATDPLYVLYTSGTTGKPKGVVRSNGGHSVAMKWSMNNIYNAKQGDVFWAASDVGWVVGHSYIVYGPLLNGCTTILYEGKPVRTPNPGAFWRACEEYKVNVLFAAPTAFRAIKKEDPTGEYAKQYDLSSVKSIFVAGERCDSDTLHWTQDITGKDVIDHWWQTETGWAIAANPLGLDPMKVKPGSPTKPMPGFNLKILDEKGNECRPGQLGNLCLKLPLPPSCLMSVWGDDTRFKQSYLSDYPGYYLAGDSGYIDEDGYVWVMGRIDGVINVAGHRLSTGEMEEIISTHQDVAECAVIGVDDELKGELPMGFVVLKDGVTKSHEEVSKEVVALVRHEIGAVAALKLVTVVEKLPKTRSGKILRGTMRSIADGKVWNMPSTIEDETVLDGITVAIKALGYPQK